MPRNTTQTPFPQLGHDAIQIDVNDSTPSQVSQEYTSVRTQAVAPRPAWMALGQFRDEFQDIDTVEIETTEERVTVPVSKPDEKTTSVAQSRRPARQSQPAHIAQMLIIIAENGFTQIVQMLDGGCWHYPLIAEMFPKVAHGDGSEETLTGLSLVGKTPHETFVDSFGAFDTDGSRVVVELTDSPQNSLTVPPGVAELVKLVCQ